MLEMATYLPDNGVLSRLAMHVNPRITRGKARRTWVSTLRFANFDSINFDGISVPTSMSYTPQAGQEMLGDWMWDMVMDDFTMPTL